MEGRPGFVVRVAPSKEESITYHSEGLVKTLGPEDEFIGYFWQVLTESNGVQCHLANITRIVPNDGASKLYHYADEAWFDMGDIKTTIVALRGPVSNNRFLAKKYRVFETWNITRNETF